MHWWSWSTKASTLLLTYPLCPRYFHRGATTSNIFISEFSMAMASRKNCICTLSQLCQLVMWMQTHACMNNILNKIVHASSQVYSAHWWMMAYGSPTPKRQQARSNWKGVAGLDTGPMAAATMRQRTQHKTTSSELSMSRLKSGIGLHAWFFIFLICMHVKIRQKKWQMEWKQEFESLWEPGILALCMHTATTIS